MDYASSPNLPSKRARAELIALALAALLVRGGEQIAVLGSSGRPWPRRPQPRRPIGRARRQRPGAAPL
jgi:hypothetical protein